MLQLSNLTQTCHFFSQKFCILTVFNRLSCALDDRISCVPTQGLVTSRRCEVHNQFSRYYQLPVTCVVYISLISSQDRFVFFHPESAAPVSYDRFQRTSWRSSWQRNDPHQPPLSPARSGFFVTQSPFHSVHGAEEELRYVAISCSLPPVFCYLQLKGNHLILSSKRY